VLIKLQSVLNRLVCRCEEKMQWPIKWLDLVVRIFVVSYLE
jgi:hypothetical protein